MDFWLEVDNHVLWRAFITTHIGRFESIILATTLDSAVVDTEYVVED